MKFGTVYSITNFPGVPEVGANTHGRPAYIKPMGPRTMSASALAVANANDINADNWGMSILSRV